MSYNGSGVYTLPAGSVVTDGTTIDAADHNTPIQDIETALNAVVLRNGVTAFTGNQNMGGYKLRGLAAGNLVGDAPRLDQVQSGIVSQATAVGGTVDAITLTFDPQFAAYTDKMKIRWTSAGVNTVTNPTINVSGLGNKTLKKAASISLAFNDTGEAGYICEAVYNGTDFILLNPQSTVGARAATATEQLTGTSTTRFSTPDSDAALWEAGADITDGAAITIGEGGYFNLITSTTAITSFSVTTDKAGRTFRCRFNTARTLTHNATSLILPGGANITTVQGDIAQFRSLGSGNVVCDWYTRADGKPVIRSRSLGSIDTSTGASASLGSLVLTPYRALKLVVNGLSGSAATNFLIGNSTSDDVRFTADLGGAGGTFTGIVEIDLVTGIGTSILLDSGSGDSVARAFDSAITTASTAISVAPASGNLDAGSITVYGLT